MQIPTNSYALFEFYLPHFVKYYSYGINKDIPGLSRYTGLNFAQDKHIKLKRFQKLNNYSAWALRFF